MKFPFYGLAQKNNKKEKPKSEDKPLPDQYLAVITPLPTCFKCGAENPLYRLYAYENTGEGRHIISDVRACGKLHLGYAARAPQPSRLQAFCATREPQRRVVGPAFLTGSPRREYRTVGETASCAILRVGAPASVSGGNPLGEVGRLLQRYVLPAGWKRSG